MGEKCLKCLPIAAAGKLLNFTVVAEKTASTHTHQGFDTASLLL